MTHPSRPHHNHPHTHKHHLVERGSSSPDLPDGVVALSKETMEAFDSLTDQLATERHKIHEMKVHDGEILGHIRDSVHDSKDSHDDTLSDDVSALMEEEEKLSHEIDSEFKTLHKLEKDRDRVMQAATGFKTDGTKGREIFEEI